MTNATLFLPGFHLATLRRRPRSAAQRLADEKARIRQHSISQLGDCFGHFIPTKALENGPDGAFSRRRLFSKENTFWAFFSQILDADGGCQEVVRKVQALAAARSMSVPSASTSAYCQARSKLDPAELENILAHTAEDLQQQGRRPTAARPKTYSSKAEAAGGKIVALSWSTARVSAWRIRTPINKTGLNQKARSPAAAFRRHEFAPASACKREPC